MKKKRERKWKEKSLNPKGENIKRAFDLESWFEQESWRWERRKQEKEKEDEKIRE
jgi:hypothetical protein